MRFFSPEILEQIQCTGLGEEVYFVGLGRWDFQFAYGDLRVQAYNKIILEIDGTRHEWADHQPLSAPVWKLIGQEVEAVEGIEDKALKFLMASGDQIEVWTDDGPYEAVVVEIEKSGKMEVF